VHRLAIAASLFVIVIKNLNVLYVLLNEFYEALFITGYKQRANLSVNIQEVQYCLKREIPRNRLGFRAFIGASIV
jgi:hypothetical protein